METGTLIQLGMTAFGFLSLHLFLTPKEVNKSIQTQLDALRDKYDELTLKVAPQLAELFVELRGIKNNMDRCTLEVKDLRNEIKEWERHNGNKRTRGGFT